MGHSVTARVIPALLLRGAGLVKTVRFRDPVYLGDPINAVRIFNEREVDELILLDIMASRENRPVQFERIGEIVSEAFMPVGYGGGIRNTEDALRLLGMGLEKIILCTAAAENPGLVTSLAERCGRQSVVVCIDVKRDSTGRYRVCTAGGTKMTTMDPAGAARAAVQAGAGELIVNNIDLDGTMAGYDMELVSAISSAVNVPTVACGGARNVADMADAVKRGGASAAAAGSLFVFHGKHRGVLVNYPGQAVLRQHFTTHTAGGEL